MAGAIPDKNVISANLYEIIHHISEEIGPRSLRDIAPLQKTAEYIAERFKSFGLRVERQGFDYSGNTYENIIVEVKGTHDDKTGIVIIGAHYDTVAGSPGADDNTSGIAGLLELARLATLNKPERTIRFVAFCLEEPPVFMTRHMGSHICAESLRKDNTEVHGMISLEMLGYYSEHPGSQNFPSAIFRLFYPSTGDFITFVGNIASRRFLKKLVTGFRSSSHFPCESFTGISLIPGVSFSDHQSFWKFGYPAVMITDTAFFRNPHYHGRDDTADTLDYNRMADLITGLHSALGRL